MSATEDVRLLIADTKPSAFGKLDGEGDPIFSDEEIKQFLSINRESVKRAAADALDTIASSEALLSKKITTQDRSTDGPAVADALRRHAEALRKRAQDEEDAEEEAPFVMVFPMGRS